MASFLRWWTIIQDWAARFLNIYVVGGTAILLNFTFRESTIDVDAYFKARKAFDVPIEDFEYLFKATL